MIVKGTEEEAVLLDDCLENLHDHVSGIFITITQPNKAVEDIARKYKSHISHFEWCNDFAKARNFNFSQVTKDYTHILWADSDDNFRGLIFMEDAIKSNPNVDVFSVNYLYHFNEFKQPDVVHMKTQIVKNDGCVEWVGKLHEDFKENRQITRYFIEGLERIHMSQDDRMLRAKTRNVEVALHDVANNPHDPRSYWNLGNSYMGNGQYLEAKETLTRFMETSSSDEEKYLTCINLSKICEHLGDKIKAIDYGRMAIGIKPEYPDAYHSLGQVFYNLKRYQDAEKHILLGLTKKPPYYSIIVFNPRDYDFNPLMLLAKTYWQLSRPDQAITCLKGCLNIQPKNQTVISMLELLEKDKKLFDRALRWLKKLKKITDKEEMKKVLKRVPKDLRSYPAICMIRNAHFVKETSTGKDIVYYCGMTDFEWSPEIAKVKGVGGSEEAVINLTKEWAKQGYNVTVYNSCGHEEQEYDGVKWKPFWMFNVKDKQDVLILWRTPIPCDHNLNADKVIIDLHDVVPEGEFTKTRLDKIHKIFVKTKFHRSLFPNVPDEKFSVIPNGQDFDLFKQDVKKDQYLLVNTSSPDRSMDVLPKLFAEVKKQVPEARCKWAYGFDIYDIMHATDPIKSKWKDDTVKAMADAGIENMGRLSQKECAKLYLEANILAYPSEFAEIDCISVKKAQACGAIPVTTDFGAFNESVQFGIKIHSDKTKDTWATNNQFTFGIQDEAKQKEWVDAVVKILRTPIEDRNEMKDWTRRFEWPIISTLWIENLK